MDYDSLDDILEKIHSCKVEFDSDELRKFIISIAQNKDDSQDVAIRCGVGIYSKALISYYLYDQPHKLTIDYENKKVLIQRI